MNNRLPDFLFFFRTFWKRYENLFIYFSIAVPFIIPLKKFYFGKEKHAAVVKTPGESGEKFGKNCARLSMLSSFSSYRGIYDQDVVLKTFAGNTRGDFSNLKILIIKFRNIIFILSTKLKTNFRNCNYIRVSHLIHSLLLNHQGVLEYQKTFLIFQPYNIKQKIVKSYEIRSGIRKWRNGSVVLSKLFRFGYFPYSLRVQTIFEILIIFPLNFHKRR